MSDFAWDKTPDIFTPTEDLLKMVNRSMTQGGSMTRGNLAFSYLCERIGFSHSKQQEWIDELMAEDEKQFDPVRQDLLARLAEDMKSLMVQKDMDVRLADWERELLAGEKFSDG